jgi:hypothetical protein
MSRRRIVCVACVRPNFMKVAALLRALRGHHSLEGLLVRTGLHYDASMSDSFLRDLELPEPVAHLRVGPDLGEGQNGMKAVLAGVAVACPFLEVAIDLEDRTVEVHGQGTRSPAVTEDDVGPASVDALELVEVPEGEGAQPLAGRGRRRDFESVAQLAGDGLVAQHLQVGETVATDQEVGGQPHHEVFDRDAAAALLDGEGAEILDRAQLQREVEYEARAGERSGRLGSGPELDAAETTWNLRLASAPSLEEETCVISASLPRLEHFFYALLARRVGRNAR